LERLGIDTCGARVSLAQACAAKGLDAGAVLREIDAPNFEAETADWLPASPSELADVIESTHHAYLRRELPRLAGLMTRVAAVHGVNHPELRELRDVFAVLQDKINDHMIKQETNIFPLIRRRERTASAVDAPRVVSEAVRACGTDRVVSEAIRAAGHEQDEVGAALARIRALTGGYAPPADACTSYRALLAGLAELETDMHSHTHKEDEILFPEVIAAVAARPDRRIGGAHGSGG
jgi:regulator of cell morphogenesis and NO signaling